VRPLRTFDRKRGGTSRGARPDALGVPYTRWSLSKLSRFLRSRGVEISPAHLGRILAINGISLQRTRSWKQSPDPDYEAKAARILALYREQPRNGVVIRGRPGKPGACPPSCRVVYFQRRRRARLATAGGVNPASA
jgi:hypothetical protein